MAVLENEFVKEAAIAALEAGRTVEDYRAFMEAVRSLLQAQEDDEVEWEDDNPKVTLMRPVRIKDGAVQRGDKSEKLPLRVRLLMEALADNAGQPCTQDTLAAAMKSPKTSVPPTISTARKALNKVGLPATEVIVTIPSPGEAMYQWSREWELWPQ